MLSSRNRDIVAIASTLVAIVLITILPIKQCGEKPEPMRSRVEYQYVHDTTIIPGDTFYVASKPQKIYYRDTIVRLVGYKDTIKVNPFTVRLDTAIAGLDSLRVEYMYPESVFALWAKTHPDTNVTNYIYKDSIVYIKEDNLTRDIATHFLTAVAGYLAGRIK